MEIKLIFIVTIVLAFIKIANTNLYTWEVVLYPLTGYVLLVSVIFLGWIFTGEKKND